GGSAFRAAASNSSTLIASAGDDMTFSAACWVNASRNGSSPANNGLPARNFKNARRSGISRGISKARSVCCPVGSLRLVRRLLRFWFGSFHANQLQHFRLRIEFCLAFGKVVKAQHVAEDVDYLLAAQLSQIVWRHRDAHSIGEVSNRESIPTRKKNRTGKRRCFIVA